MFAYAGCGGEGETKGSHRHEQKMRDTSPAGVEDLYFCSLRCMRAMEALRDAAPPLLRICAVFSSFEGMLHSVTGRQQADKLRSLKSS